MGYFLEDGTEISEEEAQGLLGQGYTPEAMPDPEPVEESGWGDVFQHAVSSFVPATAKAAGGLIRAYEDFPLLPDLLPGDVGKTVVDRANNYQSVLDSGVQLEPGSLKDNAYRSTQMATQILPYLMAPGAGAAAATAGLSTLGERFGSLRDQGADLLPSYLGAGADAAITGTTSLLPFGAAFGPKSPLKRLVGTTLANTGANAGQAAASDVIEEMATGRDNGRSSLEAGLNTVIPSLLTGGVMAAGGEAQARIGERALGKQQAQINDQAAILANEALAPQAEVLPPVDVEMQGTQIDTSPEAMAALDAKMAANPSDYPTLTEYAQELKQHADRVRAEQLMIEIRDNKARKLRRAGLIPPLEQAGTPVDFTTKGIAREKSPGTPIVDPMAAPIDQAAQRFSVAPETPTVQAEQRFAQEAPVDSLAAEQVRLQNEAIAREVAGRERYAEIEHQNTEPITIDPIKSTRVIPISVEDPTETKVTLNDKPDGFEDVAKVKPAIELPEKQTEVKAVQDIDARNKERGALAIGDIVDRIGKVHEFLRPRDPATEPVKTNDPELESFLSGDGGVWIPKTAKAKLRKELTLPITMAERSPLFKPIYEGWRNFQRNHHAGVVEDMESLRSYTDLGDTSKVDKALAAYRLAQKKIRDNGGKEIQMTPERLMAPDMGLTKPEVEAFYAVRDYFDTVGKEKLRSWLQEKAKTYANPDEKMKEIDMYVDNLPPGYVPFMRFGDFEVRGTTKDGKKYVSHHESMSDAKRAARELGKQNGSKFSYGKRQKFSNEAYDFMSGDLSGPLSFLARELEGEAPNGGLPVRGMAARLQHAEFVEGFDPNMKRSILEYVNGTNRALAKAKVEPVWEQALNDMIKAGETNEGVAFSKKYIDDIKANKGANAVISNLAFHFYLGGNVKSAALNLTQPLTVAYPALGEHVKNPSAVLVKAYKKAFDYTFKNKSFTQSNSELARAIETAKKNGAISSDEFHRMFDLKTPRNETLKRIQNASGMFQQMTEGINRTVGFVAGYEAGKAKRLTGDALQKFAEDFNTNVNFGYGVGDRPALARKAPDLFVFRLFTGNYLRHMFKAVKGTYGNEALPGFARQVVSTLRFAAPMLGLTGIAGAPLANTVLKALESAGYDTKNEIKKLMGDGTIADSMMYGLPMSLLGANVSGALGLGNLAPDFEEGPAAAAARFGLGVALDPLQRVAKAGWLYGAMNQPGRAVETLLPEGVKNIAKAVRAEREGVLNPSGKTIVYPEQLTPWDKSVMALGFTPSTVTKAYDQKNSTKVAIDSYQAEAAKRNNRIFQIVQEAGPKAYQQFEGSKDPMVLVRALSPDKQQELRTIFAEMSPDQRADYKKIFSSSILPKLRDHFETEYADYKRLPKALRKGDIGQNLKRQYDKRMNERKMNRTDPLAQ